MQFKCQFTAAEMVHTDKTDQCEAENLAFCKSLEDNQHNRRSTPIDVRVVGDRQDSIGLRSEMGRKMHR